MIFGLEKSQPGKPVVEELIRFSNIRKNIPMQNDYHYILCGTTEGLQCEKP